MPVNTVSASWVSRLKLGLIPLLGVILLVVLLYPTSDTTSQSDGNEQATELIKRPSADANSPNAAAQQAWERIDPARASAYNPFRPLGAGEAAASLAKAATPSAKETEKKLVYLKVDAIHEADGVYAALVAGKLIRVGDSLPDERRVLAITQLGVLVAPADR